MVLKQPKSLLQSASAVLGGVIAMQYLAIIRKMYEVKYVDYEDDKYLQSNIEMCAAFYDDSIPAVLHNQITFYTQMFLIATGTLVPESDLNIFDIILRRHITELDFSKWPNEMHHMLHMTLPKLKDLKYLHLDLGYLRNENLNDVLKGLEGMKSLKSFSCAKCTNEVLKTVCNNCPLKNLNLQWQNLISDDSVSEILKLKKLENLDIGHTAISAHGHKQIFLKCPALKVFAGPNLNNLLREIGGDIVTSLECADWTCNSERDMVNLVQSCPYVKKLYLTDVRCDQWDLSNLVDLKHLTTLYLSGMYSPDIQAFLKVTGYQITELRLLCIVDILLGEIDSLCPNLKTLSLKLCFGANEANDFSGYTSIQFQNLECLHVYSDKDATPCFIFILSVCPKLKEVYFERVGSLTDTNIIVILACNPLEHLEKFIIDDNKLTVDSFYRIVQSCVSLRWLGNVGEWKTTTQSDVTELKRYIRSNNLDIRILHDWRDGGVNDFRMMY